MSKLEDLFRREIRGPRMAIAIICGILFVPPAIYFGWPVSGYAAVALIAMYTLRRTQNVFGKAAVSLLKPVTIGLSLALLVAFYLNSAHLLGHTDAQALRRFEEAVMALAERFSIVGKLPLLCLVALYLLLAVLSMRFPRLRLVKYVGAGRKYLGLMAGVLTTLASVTFFSATAADHRAATARSRITAQYRASKEREAKLVAQYLALSTTSEAVHALKPADRQFYLHFFDLMHIYYAAEAVKVARLSGRGLLESTRGKAVEENPEKEEIVGSYGQLDAQRDREKQYEATHEVRVDQAQEALKKVISELIGAGTEALRNIAFAWFESAATAAQADLMTQLKKYIGRSSDDFLEAKMKPYVDEAAASLADRLGQIVQRNRRARARFGSSEATVFDEIISDTCKDGVDEVIRDAEIEPGTESAKRKLNEALIAERAIEQTPFHTRSRMLSATTQQLTEIRAGRIKPPEAHPPPPHLREGARR
jgi:hypothetical protein